MRDPDQPRDWDEDGPFFDPQRDSAAELITELAHCCRDRAGEHPSWSRWEGAFDWLRETVGLNLMEIQRRWEDLPVISADLAAIALCRTHDLPRLIRSVQSQPKFAFLRKHNLIEKVREANDILHGGSSGGSTVDTLRHQNWLRGLARQWVLVLEEMIVSVAPTPPCDRRR
jgi:hypothetical protein